MACNNEFIDLRMLLNQFESNTSQVLVVQFFKVHKFKIVVDVLVAFVRQYLAE